MRDHEHLVVHGQSEQHRERAEREIDLDLSDVRESQRPGQVSVLETKHEQPSGRADSEKVHDDRLQWEQ
ncbi:hypothetical protein Vau01_119280 [Virgisporangium aurantiacum]|uniref:Uncharacterized protein n=1 Tax=Virgisporangium aurantiacum TaxID=175570 RepID=A0A8J3ZHV8_9ACTN|nr:hypothetical protein Vau01_119280 [Virgisporangium aurantiacum]